VAYADFVTAMMALFIVLWLLTQADAKLKKELAQYFRDGVFKGSSSLLSGKQSGESSRPSVIEMRQTIIEQNRAREEEEALQHEAAALKAQLDRAAAESPELAELRQQVSVSVTPEGLLIQVLDRDWGHDLMFDVASAELKPALVQLLRRVAAPLGKLPNSIQVCGHTDGRAFPSGASRSNWDLSFERANNARKVLEVSGLRAGQVQRVLAYADSELLVKDNPLAPENRRLTILALRAGGKSGTVEPHGKSGVEPHGKSGAVEPHGKSGAVEPHGMSGAVEPRGRGAVEPRGKSPLVTESGVKFVPFQIDIRPK
jgi:chemotaxis protein MotB